MRRMHRLLADEWSINQPELAISTSSRQTKRDVIGLLDKNHAHKIKLRRKVVLNIVLYQKVNIVNNIYNKNEVRTIMLHNEKEICFGEI